MLANPPFGVEWKKQQHDIEWERDTLGHDGRFGAGLPRINDGSLLFLQHMLSKMQSVDEGGSRIAIVFNGSPLFTGDAGSGESNIRQWLIENDWLEAIVALPDQPLLQHRHFHLRLGADQPEGTAPHGPGAVDRRAAVLREDAQELG